MGGKKKKYLIYDIVGGIWGLSVGIGLTYAVCGDTSKYGPLQESRSDDDFGDCSTPYRPSRIS